VATAACAHDRTVIDATHPVPQNRVMTQLTLFTCLDVAAVLAARSRAVVATRTRSGDIPVFKARVLHCYRGMAIVAIVTALYMIRCFANRGNAIVAQGALTRRALENTLTVTTGTFQSHVRPC